MRNIFDQYSQPENRLTHALVCALEADPKLLRRFVHWITGKRPGRRLHIVEQRLPGEQELDEDEFERRGLPDAWIHDDQTWCLLIESKVSSALSLDQLKRHFRTAQRRGFDDVLVLAIDVTPPTRQLPAYVVSRTWREVYSWLVGESTRSDWAVRALKYMEVAERKWPVEGYLKEGTLTEFAGVSFDENNPYSYPEAKRLLRLIMDELRQHPSLLGTLGIVPKAAGRAAITGKKQSTVWDYLRMKGLDSTVKHTLHPHMTMLITRDELRAFLNVPNSMESRFRRAVLDLGEEGFFDVMAEVNKGLARVTRSCPGSYPFANILQRRFASQRAIATIDGKMEFDLRTAFSGGKAQKVKVQDEWLSTLYSLISKKRSNLEYAVGIKLPYATCEKVRSKRVIDTLAEGMTACKPLLDVMLTAKRK